MREQRLRHLLWEFIRLLDMSEFDHLTLEEVRRHAESETIPRFLHDRFGSEIDLSIFDAADWKELSRHWSSYANAIEAGRKFGVYRKGLCLLVAYTMQSLQDGWAEPSPK